MGEYLSPFENNEDPIIKGHEYLLGTYFPSVSLSCTVTVAAESVRKDKRWVVMDCGYVLCM